MAGEVVELRHEREGVALSGTTSANGSAWFEFDSGDALDPSATTYDWASHGIIAWQSSAGLIGATTMTLDDNLVALDLVAMTDRVSIVRNRSGDVRPLNEISGYNVLPGDSLVFEFWGQVDPAKLGGKLGLEVGGGPISFEAELGRTWADPLFSARASKNQLN